MINYHNKKFCHIGFPSYKLGLKSIETVQFIADNQYALVGGEMSKKNQNQACFIVVDLISNNILGNLKIFLYIFAIVLF